MLDPWPFAVVPTEDRGSRWAGRADTLRSLNGLVGRWERRSASEIAVIWADFGQGKTHSLFHLAGAARKAPRQLVHYVQLPPLTSGSPFVALYRQLLRDFPLDLLARRVYERFQASPHDLARAGTPGIRNLIQLLWIIGTNSHGRDVAIRWLQAERIPPRQLDALLIGGRPIGIGPAPNSAQDCQNVLDGLMTVATDFPTARSGNVVLLIDEFQRIGELTYRKRVEVCDALHLLFNRHPEGFRMVLAFAGGLPEIVPNVLTSDLVSRVNSRMDLPPMSMEEGREYLSELLASYGHASDAKPFGPYDRASVDLLLGLAAVAAELSPRRINVAFDVVSNAALDARGDAQPTEDFSLDEVQRAATLLRGELVEDAESME